MSISETMHQHFELRNLSLTKVAIVLGSLCISWVFLDGIVPEPWHDKAQGVLSFLAVFIATLLKSNKGGEPPVIPESPKQP